MSPISKKGKKLETEELIWDEVADKIYTNKKVKITTGKDKGDYNWMTDTINLRRSYPTVKDFIITVLHEIKHALDRKKMGVKKYEKLYHQYGELAIQKGGDFHDDNKFEEEAEKWAIKEYPKWKNKI